MPHKHEIQTRKPNTAHEIFFKSWVILFQDQFSIKEETGMLLFSQSDLRATTNWTVIWTMLTFLNMLSRFTIDIFVHVNIDNIYFAKKFCLENLQFFLRPRSVIYFYLPPPPSLLTAIFQNTCTTVLGHQNTPQPIPLHLVLTNSILQNSKGGHFFTPWIVIKASRYMYMKLWWNN